MPRSIRPVTTVPRPEIENTSSIGIMNGLSTSRSGSGIAVSSASISFTRPATPSTSPWIAFSALTRTTGMSSPLNP